MDAFENELAKAAGQVAVDTAKDSRVALGILFGDAFREIGQAIADNARFYRLKNLCRIMDKVEEIRSSQGYTIEQMRSLPFGDALRIADAASLEDEDEVQRLWASLIANATDPQTAVRAKKVAVEILKSLSPVEAVLLDLLWVYGDGTIPAGQAFEEHNEIVKNEVESRWVAIDEEDRQVSIQNLVRLRCITGRSRPTHSSSVLGKAPRELIDQAFNDWSFVDGRKFQSLLEDYDGRLAELGGGPNGGSYKPLGVWRRGLGPTAILPEPHYMLTSLGRSVMALCGSSRRSQV